MDFKSLEKRAGTPAMKKAFINWMKPHALRIQAQTGLPAAVLVAQAIEESGWGKSGLAKKGNLFGIRCERRTYYYQPQGLSTDTHKEPKGTGCKYGYTTFDKPEDSIYAYATKLAIEKRPTMPKLYSEIRANMQKNPRQSSAVVPLIGEWMTGAKQKTAQFQKYVSTIQSHIRSNKLDELFDGYKGCDREAPPHRPETPPERNSPRRALAAL
jgi:uncharacterized FlgJ-related protein